VAEAGQGGVMRTLIFVAFVTIANGQNAFSWEQHPKLSWSDFKAKPQRGLEHPEAVTDTGFRTQLMCRGGTLEIDILAEFYPNSSWVKPNRKLTSLLKHEQGHFDITELYVRKMRNAIRNAHVDCEDDAKAEIAGKGILRPLDQEWEKAEKHYDAETKDGSDIVRQTAASERIAAELKAFSRY
jgi:hypothetical protein